MFWFGVFLILGLITIVLFPIIWLVAGIAMVGFLFYLICRVIVELVAGNRYDAYLDKLAWRLKRIEMARKAKLRGGKWHLK